MKTVRSISLIIAMLMLILSMAACTRAQNVAEREESGAAETAETGKMTDTDETDADGEAISMKMMINDTEVNVSWENNESVRALSELAAEGDVTIGMNAYGGFEQVGPIGKSLPCSDTDIRTQAGDIMLYASDSMVIFYGSNSWAYTRLGRITDKSEAELEELLSGSGVTVTITAK